MIYILNVRCIPKSYGTKKKKENFIYMKNVYTFSRNRIEATEKKIGLSNILAGELRNICLKYTCT